MAKQKGFLKIRGSIGDLNFYKTKSGYMVREKGGVDRNLIMSDPRFQRTRENMQEFKNAGIAGKTLRNAFNGITRNSKDSLLVSRMTKFMHSVLKEDHVNARGERQVVNGDLGILKGFDFNANAPWLTTVLFKPKATIDRVTGVVEVELPAYVPIDSVIAPSGATHYRILTAASAIDFVNNESKTVSYYTDYLAYDEVETVADILENNLEANSTDYLMVAIGIEFYQEVNGSYYSLKNGSFNSVTILDLDVV